MTNALRIARLSGVATLLVGGVMAAAAPAPDLSRYRDFQFGAGLTKIAQQTGADPAQAKVIHRRPALIQELDWRPQPLGASSQPEPVKIVVFSFYGGELFRVAVEYDRYQTEGMTVGDLVEAISATYGTALKPGVSSIPPQNSSDPEEIVALWQDSQYRFELVRYPYGPTFKLVGINKRLDAPVQAANLEAKRLDDQEAPERDAARLASEAGAAKAKLEKARLLNKPNFRP